jgi:hypothetical protein
MSNTSPPNLGNIITSAIARKVIYSIYGIAVVVLGAFQVAYATTPDLGGQPVWLSVALNVAAYLAVPVSALALANTPKPE